MPKEFPLESTGFNPFGELIGLSFSQIEDGYSRCSLQVTDRLLNGNRVLHGGVVFSLADTGMAGALYTRLNDDESCATVEISIVYLAAVTAGTLTCETRLVKRSKRIAVLQSDVENDGRLVAKALGTYSVIKARGDLGQGDVEESLGQVMMPTGRSEAEGPATHTLRLSDGSLLTDCEEKIRQFCREDFSYRHYDLADVPQDNVLTGEQIRLANKIIARMPQRVADAVLSKSTEINRALAGIDPTTSLEDADRRLPWDGLLALFETTLVPEVGISRMTKILHKKRPRLIPLLDEIIAAYAEHVLRTTGRPIPTGTADRAIAYMKVLREDLEANADALDALQQKLAASGIELTRVRMLDILVWAWSGYYLPIWRRS